MGLPFECFRIIHHLEQVLGYISAGLGDSNSVAVGADLLVCCQKVLGTLVMSRLVLCALKIAATARTIAKRNGGGQLRSVEERVRAVSDTRWVIVALVIVCESAPLGTCIDNPISKDEAAGAADHVARRKLFDQVWWELFALLANHLHVQVLDIRVCLARSGGGSGSHLGFVCVFLVVYISSIT